MSDKNRREFSRVVAPLEAKVTDTHGNAFSGVIVNVSMNGILISGSCEFSPGTVCEVTIPLASGEEELSIRAGAHFVRAIESNAAFEFSAIEGEDSYEHLRNLVMYNASDVDAVEGELHSHMGIRRGEHA